MTTHEGGDEEKSIKNLEVTACSLKFFFKRRIEDETNGSFGDVDDVFFNWIVGPGSRYD
jgi:hypothetical protein